MHVQDRILKILLLSLLVPLIIFLMVKNFTSPEHYNKIGKFLFYRIKSNRSQNEVLQNQLDDLPITYHIIKSLQDLDDFTKDTLSELNTEKNLTGNMTKLIKSKQKSLSQLNEMIIADVVKSDQINGKFDERKTELTKLMNIIQERIHRLQFPPDCKKAKKIKCMISPNCGFGCHFHTFASCLIDGYSKKRVVILENWHYGPITLWDTIFQPMTSCTLKDVTYPVVWNKSEGIDGAELLNVSVLWTYMPYHLHLSSFPPAFPAEFAPTLLKYHPDPSLFWIAQFMQYLMRYQPKLQNFIDAKMKLLNFTSDQPTAAIHVRRSNKVGEAFMFPVEYYMEHISDWFETQSIITGANFSTKRVLLATEEPAVINETIPKYPGFEFLYDVQGIKGALPNYYSVPGVYDIVATLYMLSRCDFIVCTFSSNICRFAHELMQITKIGDITPRVVTLDTIFHFYGQQSRQQIAKIEHTPETDKNGEIELKVGDILDVGTPSHYVPERKSYFGFMFGRNLRTGKSGRYPKYKVEEKWRIVDF